MKLLLGCKTIINNLIGSNLRIGISTLIILFAFAHPAFAVPDKVVSGQVTGADGSILNGVSVTVKGTTIGTSTDASGKFRINTSDNDTLVFTFIGYETQEIRVTNQSTVNVKLSSSTTKLNEVVVTAFGLSKERKGLVIRFQPLKAPNLLKPGKQMWQVL